MSKGSVPVTKTYEAERIRTGQRRTFGFFEDARLWVMVGLAGHVTCVEHDEDGSNEERRTVVFRC